MMVHNGKEYRNLQEQVQKNMEDIAELQENGGGTSVDIEQTSGSSTTAVMSQAAATNYTQQIGGSTLGQAKTYTDTKASTILSSANTYATNKAAEALNSSKTYTDSKMASILGNVLVENSITTTKYLLPLNDLTAANFSGKKYAAVGGSITVGVGTGEAGGFSIDYSKRYPYLVCQALGMTQLNLGTSGTTLCTGGHRTCNIGRLDQLAGADIVTIKMGGNDWDQAVKNGMHGGTLKYDENATYYDLGTPDSTDTSTIYGAMKMWCNKIVELKATPTYANTKFYFILQPITSWNGSVSSTKNWSQDKTNIHGITLRDICQAMINVCANYEIPVIDLNKYSGIYYNSATDNNTDEIGGDGIHINADGHALMAEAIVNAFLADYQYLNAPQAINYIMNHYSDSLKIPYPQMAKTFSVPITGIEITGSSTSITEGDSIQLTATLTPLNTTQTGVNWTSSNTTKATVNGGLVTALEAGSVTITATSVSNSTISDTYTLTINEAASTNLTSITVSPSTYTGAAGTSTTLTATLAPSNTPQTGLTWTSTDTNIATVTGNGLTATVNFISTGQCYIKATSTANTSIYGQSFVTTSGTQETPSLDNLAFNTDSATSYSGTTHKVTTTNAAVGNIVNTTRSMAVCTTPINAGMELDITFHRPSVSNLVVIGLSQYSAISEVPAVTNSNNAPVGNVNMYLDRNSANANILYLKPGTASVRGDYGVKLSTTTTDHQFKFIYDTNNTITIYYNGTALTNTPYASNSYYTQMLNAGVAYLVIDGLCSENDIEITYLGNIQTAQNFQ